MRSSLNIPPNSASLTLKAEAEVEQCRLEIIAADKRAELLGVEAAQSGRLSPDGDYHEPAEAACAAYYDAEFAAQKARECYAFAVDHLSDVRVYQERIGKVGVGSWVEIVTTESCEVLRKMNLGAESEEWDILSARGHLYKGLMPAECPPHSLDEVARIKSDLATCNPSFAEQRSRALAILANEDRGYWCEGKELIRHAHREEHMELTVEILSANQLEWQLLAASLPTGSWMLFIQYPETGRVSVEELTVAKGQKENGDVDTLARWLCSRGKVKNISGVLPEGYPVFKREAALAGKVCTADDPHYEYPEPLEWGMSPPIDAHDAIDRERNEGLLTSRPSTLAEEPNDAGLLHVGARRPLPEPGIPKNEILPEI